MKEYVKLSQEIREKAEAGKLKASELVSFLIGYGFDSNKPLNETSLSDLSISGQRVTGGQFDRFTGYLHLNLV